MKKKLLHESLRLASDYIPKHPEYNYYMHYSFIVQCNKIIEWDTNNSGLSLGPLYPMYQSRVKYLDGVPKTHSEVNAYRKAKGIINRDKTFEVINIRMSKNKEIRLSAPCNCCHMFLKTLNCTHVWFTTEAGWAKITL